MLQRRTAILTVCLLLVLSACSSTPPPKETSTSLTPQEGLQSLKFAEDFHAELFAAEPDVVDPVEVVFDERGRAFVAEMLDLPDDPAKGQPAKGRIRMLEDTNGDGKADKSTIFAENTMHASGLMPWNGGVIVPASPDILYFKDTNGDGKADIREVWFTGFYHGNPEAQITNPRLGVDNWIYFSNTGNEGLVKSPKWPNRPAVQLRGFDFRFHPVTGEFEPVSGNAQYGATFDDWGNRFISQNTTHLRHVVLDRRYLARAPMLEVASVVEDPYGKHHREMYPLTPPEEWRVIRTKMRNDRFNELKNGRVEILAGHFSGATGSTWYSGDAWPDAYRNGSIFTADVSGNLVRRDIVTPNGVTFTAVPAPKTEKEKTEFLASTDRWFRPTNFANAPDGNLYVTDMQRETIETPLSIPEELRKKIDFYAGHDKGRIYRIVANQPRTKRGLAVNLGDPVKALEHPNGWHRETAHRLLLERMAKAAVPALKTVATSSTSAPARLRAHYLLQAYGAYDQALAEKALTDAQPEIREHAVRFAERYPALLPKLVQLAKAENTPRIAMQLALSLGNFPADAPARTAIVDIAKRNISDRWFRIAALSSSATDPQRFFAALVNTGVAIPEDLAGMAGSLIGSRTNGAEIAAFATSLSKAKPAAQAGLAGVARGLKLAGARGLKSPGIELALAPYLSAGMEEAWDTARYFDIPGLVDRAAKDALSPATDAKKRRMAVMALRGATYAKAQPIIAKVLDSAPPAEVQAAAVNTLASFEDPGVANELLAHWPSYSPEARQRAITAMLAQKPRIPILIAALEKETVPVNALEMNARVRLLELNDPALAARAKKVLQSTAGDRAQIMASFQPALNLKGDPVHGKKVFEDNCAKCHLPGKQGTRVGPDLSGINMKTKDELLTAILDPSASIEPRFVNYVVTAKDGTMYDGVLANETPGAMTLRGGPDGDVTILRSKIADVRASAMSLMPEGLEEKMSKQDMADLLSYLRGGL
ncbi:cytochrome c [Bryobacterales bacterium F-183]|nr:cytochrome c [Bryobacterales bacterium F-183]